jgi:hypothetical protein
MIQGIAQADKEGLHCRVEASPMGRPTYASCGCVDLEGGEPWKVQVKGQKEVFTMWCMFRHVQSKNGKETEIGVEGEKVAVLV